MVQGKRADISASCQNWKISCEVKRDYHSDLWTAASSQLGRYYAQDLEASGFGIYVVLWFGTRRPKNIKRINAGTHNIKSPMHLERLLQEGLGDDHNLKISVVVLDVSADSSSPNSIGFVN